MGPFPKVAGAAARKAIFTWAMRVGGWNQRAYRKGRRPSLALRAMLPLADKLTLADMNEESANMLALQTRQQLAINSLSLASQAAQSVLKLF